MEKDLKEIQDIINSKNLSDMLKYYLDMVEQWVRLINDKNKSWNSSYSDYISISNDIHEISCALKNINEYRGFIDYISILQGVFEEKFGNNL